MDADCSALNRSERHVEQAFISVTQTMVLCLVNVLDQEAVSPRPALTTFGVTGAVGFRQPDEFVKTEQ